MAVVLIGSPTLLCAVVLIVGLARTITRPILALQASVSRFGRGDLAVRLPETSRDELGVLAREFNAMAAAIADKDAHLRALFAAMPDVILVIDAQGRYLDMLPTSPNMPHTPAAAVIGRRLHEVLSPAHADLVLAEAMGGSLDLESTGPEGSAFRLHLPLVLQ